MTPEQEIKYLKSLIYCTEKSCNNCGKVECENFQRQRKDCCELWVSFKDYILDLKANCDLAIEGRDIKIKELEEENNKFLDVISNYEVKIADLEKQIEKMKCCGNCKQRELIREHGQWKERFNCKGNGCVCYNKWRLKNE